MSGENAGGKERTFSSWFYILRFSGFAFYGLTIFISKTSLQKSLYFPGRLLR